MCQDQQMDIVLFFTEATLQDRVLQHHQAIGPQSYVGVQNCDKYKPSISSGYSLYWMLSASVASSSMDIQRQFTSHVIYMMRASTIEVEKRIVKVEHDQENTQVAYQQLEIQLVATIVEHDVEHQVFQAAKQAMSEISQNISKIWPNVHSRDPFPSLGLFPSQQKGVELLFASWKKLRRDQHPSMVKAHNNNKSSFLHSLLWWKRSTPLTLISMSLLNKVRLSFPPCKSGWVYQNRYIGLWMCCGSASNK